MMFRKDKEKSIQGMSGIGKSFEKKHRNLYERVLFIQLRGMPLLFSHIQRHPKILKE